MLNYRLLRLPTIYNDSLLSQTQPQCHCVSPTILCSERTNIQDNYSKRQELPSPVVDQSIVKAAMPTTVHETPIAAIAEWSLQLNLIHELSTTEQQEEVGVVTTP